MDRTVSSSSSAHVRDAAVMSRDAPIGGSRRFIVVTRLIVLLLLLAFGGVVPGCDEAPAPRAGAGVASRPLTVVATTGMIADVVRQVAGERAEVIQLMGPGVDPHLYQPTRSDVIQLRDADVIFYNGLMLEGRMGDVLARMNERGIPAVAVAEEIAPELRLEAAPGEADPHLWMDVGAWMGIVPIIAQTLSEADSDPAAPYADNAAAYAAELMELDEFARQTLASISRPQRVLVTAHDAFRYFGLAYDIDVRGIQGISTESEPGLRDIQELIDFLVEREIAAIFVETSVSQENVNVLIEGAAARGHTVEIGGELYSDAMGPTDTWEGTYIGMIDHNVTTIARALGGDVLDGGFREFVTQQDQSGTGGDEVGGSSVQGDDETPADAARPDESNVAMTP